MLFIKKTVLNMTKPEHSHLFLISQVTIHVIDRKHTKTIKIQYTHTQTYTQIANDYRENTCLKAWTEIGMGENSRNHVRPQGPMGARWDSTIRDMSCRLYSYYEW